MLPTELGSVMLSFRFGQREPAFRDVTDAFQFLLHFVVFGFERGGVRVLRDFDRRREDDYCTAKRSREQKMVPGFFERLTVLDADMEDRDRAARTSCKHDRTGLGDVARSAGTVDGEGTVLPFLDALGDHGQTAQAAAGRATVRGGEAEPLDDLASPLTVEGCGVHDHDAHVPRPPGNGNDDTVPEGPDAAAARGVNLLGMVPAEDFKAQRWTEYANHGVNQGGNDRNLNAAGPREGRQASIVMSAEFTRFRSGSFSGG